MDLSATIIRHGQFVLDELRFFDLTKANRMVGNKYALKQVYNASMHLVWIFWIFSTR